MGLIYIVLVLAFVVGAGATYLILNPPSDLIRQKIVEEVKARTGRDVEVAGPASFTLFPELGVSLEKVSLSAPPGMGGRLVEMKSLDISVKALTLLTQPVEINSIILRRPVFDFRVDKDGHSNWKLAAAARPTQLAELAAPGSVRDAGGFEVADAEQRTAGLKLAALDQVRLGDIRVEDGTFRFTDERNGRIEQVSGVNVKLGLHSSSSPLVANGNFAWHDRRIDFEGRVPDIANVLGERPGHLAFSAKNDLISASYDGGILIKDGAYLEGDVKADAQSARALADWFGTALPPVSGFGALSIRGTLKTRGNVTSFSNAEFGLDGASAKGTIKVTTGGARPFVEASLSADELDLNKYLTSAVTGVIATDGPVAGDATSPSSQNGSTQPDEIEKLLKSQGTKVYAAVQREGWSSEKLNLTLLGVADGNAQVSVGKLHFKNVTVGKSDVAVAVKDHAMTATFSGIELYQGRGKGTVTVDGSSGSANIDANFSVGGVAALPFLKDAVNFERVSGNADVGFDLKANGESQLQLIESLNGRAQFRFADGAVIGFNLPAAIRGLANGNFLAFKTSPTEKTDFSALSASFTITNGTAENKDLQLVSPLLRVTGGGFIHLPERTVDYTVKPKLVASLEGQANGEKSADDASSGIEVPVHITGSWDHPAYRPDLKGVLSDPNKTVDTIKEIGKKLKGKNAGEIVDELFGKKGDGSSGGKKSAKDLLNKLLGKDDDKQQE